MDNYTIDLNRGYCSSVNNVFGSCEIISSW